MKRHKSGTASRQRAERRAQAREQAARKRREQEVTKYAANHSEQGDADVDAAATADEHGQPLPPVRSDENWC